MSYENPMRRCVLCDETHVNTNDSANCVWFGELVADRACCDAPKNAEEVEQLRREWGEE